MDEPKIATDHVVMAEPTSVTVVCPECGTLVRIRDIHAFVMAEHLAVCPELASLNP